MPDMNKLKKYLKDRRETQERFAARVGVAQSFISNLVNDNQMPSLALAVAIEDATRGRVKARSWVDDARERAGKAVQD